MTHFYTAEQKFKQIERLQDNIRSYNGKIISLTKNFPKSPEINTLRNAKKRCKVEIKMLNGTYDKEKYYKTQNNMKPKRKQL